MYKNIFLVLTLISIVLIGCTSKELAKNKHSNIDLHEKLFFIFDKKGTYEPDDMKDISQELLDKKKLAWDSIKNEQLKQHKIFDRLTSTIKPIESSEKYVRFGYGKYKDKNVVTRHFDFKEKPNFNSVTVYCLDDNSDGKLDECWQEQLALGVIGIRKGNELVYYKLPFEQTIKPMQDYYTLVKEN